MTQKIGLALMSVAGSVGGLTVINSFFAANAGKLYRQSNEEIFLILIIGSERILVRS